MTQAHDLPTAGAVHSPVGLEYSRPDPETPWREDRLLLVVSPGLPVPVTGAPTVHLAIPSLGEHETREIWTSDLPIERIQDGPIVASRSGDLLCGAVVASAEEDLRAATFRIYGEILAFARSAGMPHLVRVWNYFPRINEVETHERYQLFCVGRAEAFEHGGVDMFGGLPAGSAVGSNGGPLMVVFLASTRPPRYVENRRQVSAYRYPRRYGPRSPSFARGALLSDQRTLFVSGTASIVGHESMHAGDVTRQLEETLRNLDQVVEEAFGCGVDLCSPDLETRLKVYLRHAGDYPQVSHRLRKIVPQESTLFLQADICRADLLIEIEAFVRRHVV